MEGLCDEATSRIFVRNFNDIMECDLAQKVMMNMLCKQQSSCECNQWSYLMDPQSNVFGIAIIFATFFGPIFAVIITRFIDGMRQMNDRQAYIFRAFMSARLGQINNDIIQASNLIEIDFHNKPAVLDAWRAYFENLRTIMPTEQIQVDDLLNKRRELNARLLDQMARALNYKIEQLDILRGGYYPDGAVLADREQSAVRGLFAAIARGEKTLPVSVKESSAEN